MAHARWVAVYRRGDTISVMIIPALGRAEAKRRAFARKPVDSVLVRVLNLSDPEQAQALHRYRAGR